MDYWKVKKENRESKKNEGMEVKNVYCPVAL
jgi:hypothetical protein